MINGPFHFPPYLLLISRMGWFVLFSGFWVNPVKSTTIPATPWRCSLSFPEATFQDINTIYIPFRLVGQLMVVEAKIDTHIGNFMVDTGSERLVLNQKYFKSRHSERSVAAVGNTGMVSSAVESQLDSIQLERLTLRNLLAHLVELNHIELKKNIRLLGILGYDVFKDFELFLDFQNRVIVMSRVDARGNRLDTIANWEHPYDSIGFDLKKHLIVVRADVNSIRLNLFLDTGAELNLIDRKVPRKVLDHFTIIKRVNLIGMGKKEVEVLAGELRDVRCGNQYTKKMNTLLTSLDEINHSFGVQVHGVLGYEFLKERRVLVNYKKRKLYFFKPTRP